MSLISSFNKQEGNELIMVEANTLEKIIRFVVAEEVNRIIDRVINKPARTYSRKEVMSILKISQPTLDTRIKKGIITPIKIKSGRRVLFNAEEIDRMVA